MSAFTVAVSAGGQSSRMGTDKAWVDLNGKPIIRHVLEHTADLGQSETILIANRPDDYAGLGLPTYTDVIPDKGALGGVYTAITRATHDHVLLVACDMPFLAPGLLRYMAGLLDETDPPPDVVVPRVDGYPQGLHAIYSKGCLPHIRERLDADRLKVIGFYGAVRVRYLDEPEYTPYDPAGRSFFNVNTPEQLAEARTIAGDTKE